MLIVRIKIWLAARLDKQWFSIPYKYNTINRVFHRVFWMRVIGLFCKINKKASFTVLEVKIDKSGSSCTFLFFFGGGVKRKLVSYLAGSVVNTRAAEQCKPDLLPCIVTCNGMWSPVQTDMSFVWELSFFTRQGHSDTVVSMQGKHFKAYVTCISVIVKWNLNFIIET